MEKTYTINEVATIMGMTLKAIRRFVASGELKAFKKNNAYSISEENLEHFKKYIDKGEHKKYATKVAAPKKEDLVDWADITPFWDNPSSSEMTFVDLFCGAGGLSKGLEMAGLQGVCGLDFFKEACMTYQRNFEHPFINGDIKNPENKRKFYDTVRRQLNGRKLSIVAGGFPCQGF